MPRYKLRTLLILLAIGPPILAGVWLLWEALKPNQSIFIPETIDYGDGRGPQPVERKAQ
jgi:hypothetical protein